MKWTICTETTFQCLENHSNRVKTKNPSRLLTTLRKISKLYSDKMFCWISHLLHNIFIDWKMLRSKQVKRPLFYLTSLWIQTSSVTGVKKGSYWLQHQNFAIDFNDCSEEFPGVWWDWIGATSGTAIHYTHCGLLPTVSIFLYLSIESHKAT